MPRSSSPQRTCNAYHEAGHAVVGHVLGRRIKEITIRPSAAIRAKVKGACGYCAFDPESEETEGITAWGPGIDNPQSIAILLVGAVAYVRLSYERDWSVTDLIDGCSNDVQAAGFLSARLTKTELGRKRLFNREERHAINLVNDYWEQVEAVAIALISRGTLSGEHVNEIILDTNVGWSCATDPS
ncbi:MAG TPA: hypothetical protein VH593_27530 [Ktedonobacteraceae bacterium]